MSKLSCGENSDTSQGDGDFGGAGGTGPAQYPDQDSSEKPDTSKVSGESTQKIDSWSDYNGYWNDYFSNKNRRV